MYHVCNSALVVAPLLRRKALEQDEALPVNQLLPQDAQELRKVAEPEVLLRDARQRRAARDEGVCGVGDLLDLGVGEDVGPLLGVVWIYSVSPRTLQVQANRGVAYLCTPRCSRPWHQ